MSIWLPVWDGAGGISASASATITFTAVASEVAKFHKSVAQTVTFAVTSFEGAHFYGNATATIILTPAAVEKAKFGESASATIIFTPAAHTSGTFHGSAAVTIIFTPLARETAHTKLIASATIIFTPSTRLRRPLIVVREQYVGRYQTGQDFNMQVAPGDESGANTLPDSLPPEAAFYAVDTTRHMGDVAVPQLPRSRVASFFEGPQRLSREWSPERYATVYRYKAGGSTSFEMAIWEIEGGGDDVGPVISGHVASMGRSTSVLVQAGSGRLLVGDGMRLDR